MKLDKSKVSDIIALTPTQEGILFHYLYAGNTEQYFEQTCLYLDGQFDQGIFELSWRRVMERNEMMRTSFIWEKISKPVQVMWKEPMLQAVYMDLSSAEQEAAIARIKASDKERGFDLRNVPFRLHLLKLESTRFLLMISTHSILYDGWSSGIVLKEFFGLYNALYQGRPADLPVKTPFKEFVKLLQSHVPVKEAGFWGNYLKGYSYNELPWKRSSTGSSSYAFGALSTVIASEDAYTLRQICKSYGCSVASLFYTMWGVLLQKLNQEDDVLFGTVFSGRSAGLKGIEDMVGNFLNTLPLRVKCTGEASLLSVLQKVAEDVRTNQEYEHSRLTDIKEYAQMDPAAEIFDTLVIFENYPVSSALYAKDAILRITDHTFEHSSNYDITLFILQSEEQFELHFAFNRNRFQDGALDRIAGYFRNVINCFIQQLHTPVKDIGLPGQEEYQKVIHDFNDTAAPYNRDINLYQMLEASFAKYHHRIAVQCTEQVFTYGQLQQQSDFLAALMLQRFGPGNLYIGIVADRSARMIVAVLAVIRAGYAYVPVDPNLPVTRMRKMMDSLGIRCVLITPGLEEKMESVMTQSENISTVYSLGEEIRMKENTPLSAWTDTLLTEDIIYPSATPEDIAYVIFTSGSTGLPKGVVVQHRPVVNIVEWINNTFEINETDKVLCVASLGFDLSVYDIFGALAKGAAISVATYEDLASPSLLAGKLVKEGITVWNSAPPVLLNMMQWCEWNEFSADGNALRLVMLSGDWIALQLPGKVWKYFDKARVVSLGGATEATIWSNYFFVNEVDPAWSSIPYGRPIQNCVYYILDKYLQPCPVNITGDLYIGGECLAMGYVNDIPLTQKKFVPDPFGKGERIYATGDLARWCNDGNIELIGRKDNQVKIRGFRVELGEIEHQLSAIQAIEQAVVIAERRENGEHYLSAYYLSDQEIPYRVIRDTLAASLPSYMIPLYITRISEIPVTANGKLDRAKLPVPAQLHENTAVELSPVQQSVANIWSDILGLSPAGITPDANFFEMGGHSLNVTTLAGRLSREYDINLQIRDIFGRPTLNGIAGLVETLLRRSRPEISPAQEKAYYNLTPVQLRMYAVQEADKNTIAYNISGAAGIQGPLDTGRVTDILKSIIQHHESLRTSFHLVDGQVMQRINLCTDVNIMYVEAGERAPEELIREFIRPFNLSEAPLIRAAIIRYSDQHHYVVLDMHHIIADGYSLRKIIQEFTLAYAGQPVTLPQLQYRDYAEYVNQPFYEQLLSSQQQYWKRQLENKISRLKLPLDFERKTAGDYSGSKVYFNIEGETYAALRDIAKSRQTTMYTTVLAIFKWLLAKVCNEAVVMVGTPVAGREHQQLADTTGMFVNTLVLKSVVSPGQTFLSFLEEEKIVVREAFENADLSFDYIATHFDKDHSKLLNPVFDVMYEYDDLDLRNIEMAGLKVEVKDDLIERAKFDITFEVIALPDSLDVRFEYKTSLFRKETIEWLAGRFMLLTQRIIADNNVKTEEIDLNAGAMMLTHPQDQQIVFNF